MQQHPILKKNPQPNVEHPWDEGYIDTTQIYHKFS